MKKFTRIKSVLFDSTNAAFTLSIQATFTRKNNIGNIDSTVYTTDSGLSVMNPSLYLVWSYKAKTYEETKNLFTSYPQRYRFLEALETIKNNIEGNKGFTTVDGVLTVKPEYQKPIILADIGAKKKSIAFSLQAIEIKGSMDRIPGVAISLPNDTEYSSVLTIEEFLTVYTIVKELDFPTIQIMLSGLYLQSLDSDNNQYQQMNSNNYQQNNSYQRQNQQQPYAAYQSNQQHSQAPVRSQSSYERVLPQSSQPAMAEKSNLASDVQRNVLPTRPKDTPSAFSLHAIDETAEDTPIDDLNIDDTETVDNIFSSKTK